MKKTNDTIIRIPLKKLHVHTLLEQVAMLDQAITYLESRRDPRSKEELAEKAAYRESFRDSLRKEGIQTPLLVVPQGDGWAVVNGRHRLYYGLEVGLEDAPCIEVGEEEARRRILAENGLTWARTKSAIAWLAVCITPEVVGTTQGSGRSDSIGTNRTELAAQVGVSADMIDQACKLWKLCGKSKKVRASVEAQVAAGCGLGGIIAGLAGDPNAGKPEGQKATRPASSLTGFTKTLGTFKTQFKELPQWTPEQQELAQGAWIEWLGGDAGARAFFQSVIDSL